MISKNPITKRGMKDPHGWKFHAMKNCTDLGTIQWFVMDVQGWKSGVTKAIQKLDTPLSGVLWERGQRFYEKSFDRVPTTRFRLAAYKEL